MEMAFAKCYNLVNIIPVRRKEFSTRIKSLKFEIEKGGGGNNYIFVKSNNIAKQFVENSLPDGL